MAPYDIVVVGAGSAGATLAARLSEDPAVTVLLLEAGPDDAAGTPANLRSANFFAAFDEPGRLWPDLLATRIAGQPEALYVRGRGVGGSSAINAMGAIRGTIDDYERWANELGCTGWGWPEMLDGFLRAEDDLDYGGDALHGRGGPVPLARQPAEAMSPLDRAVVVALTDLGHPTCDDYHRPGATGISRWALTLRDGHRVSAADGYLAPATARPNLAVRAEALVDRVLLDGHRCVGVRLADGEEISAGEVVLSAGALHSPAILLRSGIGVGDGLPVGDHLRDHAATPGFELALRPDARLTRTDVPVMTSVLRYTSGLPEGGPNDLQLIWFGGVGATAEGLAGGRIIGAVMRVFSSGRVRLHSDVPTDQPLVEFDMLSDRRDRVRLHAVVDEILRLVRHPAVESVLEGVLAFDTPLDALGSPAAVDEWLHAHVSDYVHAAGTCRMGQPGDPAAVVDLDGAVLGYEALRVCDASVMPDLPKANTHLTTVAIAERLALSCRRSLGGR